MRSKRSFGEDFCLTALTDDAALAAAADRAGINRIGVDLESLGKAERQTGFNTRMARHTFDDLSAISAAVRCADLFIRINPVHAGTETEIETALDLGARVVMLPAFRTVEETCLFTRILRGRARTVILVEMAPAVVRIRDILDVPGVDEVMIGLNDLRLQLGVANHFEVLASPLVDMLSHEVRRKGLPLAIGGVGRVGDNTLPVPTDLVFAQYPRLEATGAWIARSFLAGLAYEREMTPAIIALRRRLDEWDAACSEDLERARLELSRHAVNWRPTSLPRRTVAGRGIE